MVELGGVPRIPAHQQVKRVRWSVVVVEAVAYETQGSTPKLAT